jgi:hypothetical protein
MSNKAPEPRSYIKEFFRNQSVSGGFSAIFTREYDLPALEGLKAYACLLIIVGTCTRGDFQRCLEELTPYKYLVGPFRETVGTLIGYELLLMIGGFFSGRKLFTEL